MEDEMKAEAPQPHTQLTHAIGTDRAISMGDPARVDAIAKLMDDPQPWAFNLICQKSSTSKVGDEGRSGEFT